MRGLTFVSLALFALFFIPNPLPAIGSHFSRETSGFKLWQLPEQTHSQMLSYVIRTAHGKLIVIDGGTSGDAPYLTRFLKKQGGSVDMWIITHAHSDHFDALKTILEKPKTLNIGAIYGSLPSEDWVMQYEKENIADYQRFNAAVRAANREIKELSLGQIIEMDGLRIEVIGIKNLEIHQNAINNSSLVLRISDPWRSVLFTGDLGLEGGEKVLKGPYKHRVKADYIQMAHHGQDGVGEAFYKAVRPKVCLWPTPTWLWDNNSGKGKGSGPWRTLEVRAWMEKLGITTNYVSKDGLAEIK